jgi:hypothetical protein
MPLTPLICVISEQIGDTDTDSQNLCYTVCVTQSVISERHQCCENLKASDDVTRAYVEKFRRQPVSLSHSLLFIVWSTWSLVQFYVVHWVHSRDKRNPKGSCFRCRGGSHHYEDPVEGDEISVHLDLYEKKFWMSQYSTRYHTR